MEVGGRGGGGPDGLLKQIVDYTTNSPNAEQLPLRPHEALAFGLDVMSFRQLTERYAQLCAPLPGRIRNFSSNCFLLG